MGKNKNTTNEIVNLTPHEIKIFVGEKEVMTLPPSGTVARVAAHAEAMGELNGIPLVSQRLGEVFGLPGPQEGVRYVVSRIVFDARPERTDLLVPDTSSDGAVRDDNGNIIGVRRLIGRPQEPLGAGILPDVLKEVCDRFEDALDRTESEIRQVAWERHERAEQEARRQYDIDVDFEKYHSHIQQQGRRSHQMSTLALEIYQRLADMLELLQHVNYA